MKYYCYIECRNILKVEKSLECFSQLINRKIIGKNS